MKKECHTRVGKVDQWFKRLPCKEQDRGSDSQTSQKANTGDRRQSKLVSKTLGELWVCPRDPASNDKVEERLKNNPDIPPWLLHTDKRTNIHLPRTHAHLILASGRKGHFRVHNKSFLKTKPNSTTHLPGMVGHARNAALWKLTWATSRPGLHQETLLYQGVKGRVTC